MNSTYLANHLVFTCFGGNVAIHILSWKVSKYDIKASAGVALLPVRLRWGHFWAVFGGTVKQSLDWHGLTGWRHWIWWSALQYELNNDGRYYLYYINSTLMRHSESQFPFTLLPGTMPLLGSLLKGAPSLCPCWGLISFGWGATLGEHNPWWVKLVVVNRSTPHAGPASFFFFITVLACKCGCWLLEHLGWLIRPSHAGEACFPSHDHPSVGAGNFFSNSCAWTGDTHWPKNFWNHMM